MSTSLIRRNGVGTLNPFRMIEDMERQVWNSLADPFALPQWGRAVAAAPTFTPPADVYETGEDILVAASLPGIDASNVSVEVHNGNLTISGEQKPHFTPEQEKQVKQHYLGIPRYGRFSFTFALPCEVDSDRAEAGYQDGILRIRLPKHPTAKPVRVNVAWQNSEPTPVGKPDAQIEAQAAKSRKKTE
jgi:HSP20 family protein